MNVLGSEKFKIPVFKMKKNLDYEKIESSNDSLRHLKVEPKANLKPIDLNLGRSIRDEIVVAPKPILIIYLPNGMFREYSMKVQMIERLQSSLRDSGWLGIVFETEEKEVRVQSFTLKDSQEIQLQELKEIILKSIKGE